MYSLHLSPQVDAPILVIGLTGWGDAASAASDTVEWIASTNADVATFEPDAIFDYRSNRPYLKATSGESLEVTWPSLRLVHTRVGTRDVLVLTGNEPDYRWQAICDAIVEFADMFGVDRVVTVGAVPAPIRHSMPSPSLASTSDSRLMLPGDQLMVDSIVVPSSATSVLRAALEGAGYPTIGYWAQVPQYVSRPYWPAIHELVRKIYGQIGVDDTAEVEEIERDAMDQIHKLDDILENREDARNFVEGLGLSVGSSTAVPEDLPTADEIADEVSRFLQSAEDPDEG